METIKDNIASVLSQIFTDRYNVTVRVEVK